MTFKTRRPDGSFSPETVARMSARDLIMMLGTVIVCTATIVGSIYSFAASVGAKLENFEQRLDRIERREDRAWSRVP